MTIYVFTIFLLTSLTFYFNNNRNHITENIFFINTIIYFIFLIGFRNNIGGDWWLYEKTFYNIDINENFTTLISDFKQRSEYGFYLINVIIRKLNLSFHYVNFFVSIIFFINLSIYIRQFKNKFLALLIAFPIIILIIHCGFVRQSLALSFLFVAFYFFVKKNIFLFILNILLGFFFHYSILIFLPFIILIENKSRAVVISIFLIFSIIAYLIFSNHLFNLYEIYIKHSDNPGNFDYPKGAKFRVGINAIFAIIFLITFKKIELKNSEISLYLPISILTLLSFPLLIFFPVFIDRINFYFVVLHIFILSKLVESNIIDKKLKEVSIILIVIFYFFIYFVWSNFATHSKYWDNYSNYLFMIS
mgnify:CR=1 FL=1